MQRNNPRQYRKGIEFKRRFEPTAVETHNLDLDSNNGSLAAVYQTTK